MGVSSIERPLPSDETPQLLLYHCQVVALFNIPSVILNIVLCVPQVLKGVAATVGVVAPRGAALITILLDAEDVQPDAFVTVYV